MEALGVGEMVHNGVLYDKMNTFLDDLPFYTKWCRQASGEVLELCCGTGRLTIPLRQAGVPVTGLDFTPSMLERAQEKARQAGIDVDLVAGDMRNFDLGRTFGLIFIPFNSLQNTYSRPDLESVFAAVRRHLQPVRRKDTSRKVRTRASTSWWPGKRTSWRVFGSRSTTAARASSMNGVCMTPPPRSTG